MDGESGEENDGHEKP